MRWLYRWQHRLSLSGPEFRAVAALLALFLAGLVYRYVQNTARPIPEGAYDEVQSLLQLGTGPSVPDTSGAPQDVRPVHVAPSAVRPERHNILRSFSKGRLELNQATEAELELLPRIGPALARRIVVHRTEYGLFRRVRDLTRVKGIGPKTLERIEPYLFIRAQHIPEPDGLGEKDDSLHSP